MSCHAGPLAGTAVIRPDAARGPALGNSFLQVPFPDAQPKNPTPAKPSPSPNPDMLIQQNWAALNDTVNLLRDGGYPIPAALQSQPPPSVPAGPAAGSNAPGYLPSWLGGGQARRLLGSAEARRSLLGSVPGNPAGPPGARRRGLPELAANSAQSVLGMLRSILPGEFHSGSAPAAKHTYMKPLPITPSENMIYKDYIPGLYGREDSPGFMSVGERLSRMMGLRGRNEAPRAYAAAAGPSSEQPRAPAMAFAGEHIQVLQAQQQQQQQESGQGPLINAAEKVSPLACVRVLCTLGLYTLQELAEDQEHTSLHGWSPGACFSWVAALLTNGLAHAGQIDGRDTEEAAADQRCKCGHAAAHRGEQSGERDAEAVHSFLLHRAVLQNVCRRVLC